MYSLVRNIIKQECIPVGCIPPVAIAIRGGLHQTPPRAGTPPDQTPPPEQTPPLGAGTPPDQAPPGADTPPPPWTEFLTHASENITFPQTLFAGGNYQKPILCLYPDIHQFPILASRLVGPSSAPCGWQTNTLFVTKGQTISFANS